jgi:hypothetical protein
VIERALKLTREQASDPERFDRIARFLPGPQADFGALGPLAAELGLECGTLSKCIHDARARFKRHLDMTVYETLDFGPMREREPRAPLSPAALRAIQDEKRALLRSLCPPPAGVLRVDE